MAKINYKMINEIKEQSKVVRKVIGRHTEGGKIVFGEFKKVAGEFAKIKRFIFLGCGSSYHAALYGNLVFEEVTKLNCEAEFADEFNKRNPVIESNTAIVILSQSGETKEAIKAAKIAKQRKVLVVSITNNKKSKLAKLADVNIDQEAGKEIAIPATKTFTSQLLLLLLLALYARQIGGSGSSGFIKELEKLPKNIRYIIAEGKKIEILALKIKKQKDLMILGDKFNYPIALEGALKLKEAASVFAEGIATAEYEHGPKALNNLVVIKMNKNKIEIGGKKLTLPAASEIVSCISNVVFFQLLTYHSAILKGINPDKPKKIKKFVK